MDSILLYALQIVLIQGRTLALDLSLIVGIEPIAGTFTKRYTFVVTSDQITKSQSILTSYRLLVLNS